MEALFLFVFCFLSITRAFPTDRCIVLDQRCDMHGDNLIFSEGGVTGPECKQLCKDTPDCGAFTYFGPDSFPYHEFCSLFISCDVLDDCNDCITANVNSDCTCGISYESSIFSDNLVRIEEDVPTEQDCRRHCSSDTSCSLYTYYNENHATDKKLCVLLTEMRNPIRFCENCQMAADKCEAFEECIISVLVSGDEISSTDLLATESKTIRYISGESGCYKSVNVLAVGSGGNGYKNPTYGGGGGSGLINTTQIVFFANMSTIVEIDINTGASTYLTVEGTLEILLNATNGELATENWLGGNGYSGGGGCGSPNRNEPGGGGGIDGGDGEVGGYDGGKGTGFSISSINFKFYDFMIGKGGKYAGYYGGGGGGILVNGSGPENGDRFGEGYGGGGPGDGSNVVGSPGLIILEL